jgi:hypothetical protein
VRLCHRGTPARSRESGTSAPATVASHSSRCANECHPLRRAGLSEGAPRIVPTSMRSITVTTAELPVCCAQSSGVIPFCAALQALSTCCNSGQRPRAQRPRTMSEMSRRAALRKSSSTTSDLLKYAASSSGVEPFYAARRERRCVNYPVRPTV